MLEERPGETLGETLGGDPGGGPEERLWERPWGRPRRGPGILWGETLGQALPTQAWPLPVSCTGTGSFTTLEQLLPHPCNANTMDSANLTECHCECRFYLLSPLKGSRARSGVATSQDILVQGLREGEGPGGPQGRRLGDRVCSSQP